MIVELISVGSELLLGDILNTDAQFLSRICAQMGYDLFHSSVVGDNRERLAETLELALSRSDIVILTGGLGSTNDDITKEVVLDQLGLPLIEDQASKDRLYRWFEEKAPVRNSRKVYTFPEGASLLRNRVGTSPGAWMPFEREGKEKVVVLLPGPPGELEPMVEKELLPILRRHSNMTTRSLIVKIGLLGEYQVDQAMRDLMEGSHDPTYAPYVKEDGPLIRITSQGTGDQVEDRLKEGLRSVQERLGPYIINTDEASREETLLQLLLERKMTLSIAESLTGGLLAGRVINAPGISQVLEEAYVVYSDAAKARLLGVPKSTLKKYSAVSEEVCRAMLLGLREKTGADAVLATTGYAGPGGDEVGKVFIGLMVEEEMEIHSCHWDAGRQELRKLTVNRAMDHLILKLKEGRHEQGYLRI